MQGLTGKSEDRDGLVLQSTTIAAPRTFGTNLLTRRIRVVISISDVSVENENWLTSSSTWANLNSNSPAFKCAKAHRPWASSDTARRQYPFPGGPGEARVFQDVHVYPSGSGIGG